ncbi:MAG: lipoprotein insertase outer membrane protein LolB [Azoarcus sp.]|jgi:outer membrane lipoprotein LolB|nr:lipoprotein insertase outer membrane protein LolB [Azoarcus sp.]
MPRRALLRRCLAVVAACALAACASVPTTSTAPAARAVVDEFLLVGRLSASDGEQSAAGRLEWRRAAASDRFTLLSPFGQIVARLDAGPDGATLTFANGERLFAEQAADLLPRLFPGVAANALPPERLAAWTQAAPPPEAEVRERDAQGRPQRVIDRGWIVEYLDYRDDSPAAMPRRLDISRGDTRLRLVIDQWTTP